MKDILYDFDIEAEKDIKMIIESGYKGLYGGLNVDGILKKKNITGRKFLDSVSGVEQVINLMRISQTIEAFKRQTVLSVKKTSINYDVLADLKERASRGEFDLDE